MRYSLAAILLVLFAEAKAQSTLSGKITSQESPIDFAQVYVLSLDGSILTSSLSDSLGVFQVQYSSSSDSVVLNISRLGYKPWQQTISTELKALEVTLSLSDASKLKDFVVTGNRPVSQQGDTLSYSTETFVDGTEQNVEDVLAKLPGISVDEQSGSIRFQGKEIEKILLDGDDLTGDNYKVLSKNLSADWLEEVEILKRFTDSRLLQGIRESNEVALNLKLKEDAKAPLFGGAEVGLGSRKTYDVTTELLSYLKKFKLFALVTANNTGEGLETYDLETYNNSQLEYKGFILPEQIVQNRLSPPGFLKPERFTFHEGQFGSNNFVVNLSQKSTLRSITTVYNNRLNFNFSDSLYYFLPENNGFSLIQQQRQKQRPFEIFQDLKLESKIADNQDIIFRLQAKLNKDRPTTQNQVDEDLFADNYNSKAKEWFGGITYRNKLSTNWVNTLDVEMGNNSWGEEFSVSQNNAMQDSIQQNTQQDFLNVGIFNQLDGVVNKSWYLNILSGWSINRSSIDFTPNYLVSESNTTNYRFNNLFTEFKVKKSLKNLRISAGARLRNAAVSYQGESSNKFYFEPSVAAALDKKIKLIDFEVRGLYNIEYSFLSPNQLVDQFLLTDYRSVTRYFARPTRPVKKEFKIGSIKLNENNYSFLSANAEWVFVNSSDILAPQLGFQDDAVLTTFSGKKESKGFYSSYSLDKYFAIIASTIKVAYSHNVITTPIAIESISDESKISQSILSITSGSSITEKLNISMAYKLYETKNEWAGNENRFGFNTYFIKLVYKPIKSLLLTVDTQAIDFKQSSDIRGILNARIGYTFLKDQLSVSLKANNLTNQDAISWSEINASLSSSSTYPLQSRFYFVSVDFKF